MKTKITFSKRDYRVVGITLIAGLLLGWIFFHNGKNEEVQVQQEKSEQVSEKKTIWTCSMHPQIRMDHPGKCPICGMDLIPLKEGNTLPQSGSDDEIRMSADAMKIAGIQTIIVKRDYPDKQVYLLGKIEPDERKIAALTARFEGRIEKLDVNFTGQRVTKGQRLATIYSPSLVIAQRELLEALKYRQNNPDLYYAARKKLKLWDLTDEQVNRIEQQGEVQTSFDILSPVSGTVTRRNVALGDYVKEGSSLFQVVDLSKVWIMFDAYESDLPWLKTGDPVRFSVQSVPGKQFRGRISFIDPVIDSARRIARVRVEAQNPGLLLKPEMFANGIVTAAIRGNKKDLMIPQSAILWTGKRAVVYVKVPDRKQPTFRYREVVLGPSAGDFYIIDNGLKEGEEIAANGVFKIDAAAQLSGKPSMMNPAQSDHDGSANMKGMDMESAALMVKNGTITKDKAGHDQFKVQLTKVFKAYLQLKDALVASDVKKAGSKVAEVGKALEEVNMKLLTDKHEMAFWMRQLPVLKDAVKKIAGQTDLEKQRNEFAVFSQAFYQCIRTFGLDHVTAFYQYCPMAQENKGAYWISDTKEIRNPYMGKDMENCGETRETLE